MNAAKHENELWPLKLRITKIKDAYFKDRKMITPRILTAYVTFRSMEGRERAMEAFNPPFWSRFFVEYLCCMPNIFAKKKLLDSGFYEIEDPGDPSNIVWENLGLSFFFKAFRFISAFIFACVFFTGCFYMIWWLANFEKEYKNYLKRECDTNVDSVYTQYEAYYDFKVLAEHERLGLMHCYCRQQFNLYGESGTEVEFSDGE